MINVSLGSLILLVLALGVTLVFLWWMLGVRGVRRAETKRYKGVIMCRICSVHYESAEDEITRCPACGTMNESKSVEEI